VRVRFRLSEVAVRVRVEDPGIASAVSALFPGTEPLGDELGGEDELAVGSDEQGFYVIENADRITFDALPDLLAALEFAITRRLLEQDAGFAHLHSAGAVGVSGGMLALGTSGAGKSSIALAWSRMGLPLLGDDVVRMDPKGRLHAFPRLLKVDPELVSRANIDLEGTPAWAPGSEEAWIDPERGAGWATSIDGVAAVAGIQYQAGSSLEWRVIEKPEALRLLLASVLPTGSAPEQCVDRFIELIGRTSIVALRFGDAEEAAAWMAERAEEWARRAAPRLPR
jgi:hypothetical protein